MTWREQKGSRMNRWLRCRQWADFEAEFWSTQLFVVAIKTI